MTKDFTRYRRTAIAEMRPYEPGESLGTVSISAEDAKAGSPKLGDMIARNPKNHLDQWLVAQQYFRDNFEPLQPVDAVSTEACDEAVRIALLMAEAYQWGGKEEAADVWKRENGLDKANNDA